MSGPRYAQWTDAEWVDEPYRGFPLSYAAGLIATIVYGSLLVFLLGDDHYGWFSIVVAVPLGLYFAALAAFKVVQRHVDCALFDDWPDCDRHPACRAVAAAQAAEVQR